MAHHLVVLHEVYLNAMRAGRKRVECRLSSIRKPPFESVAEGDLLWFKVPSGPVHAFARAGKCLFQPCQQPGDLTKLLDLYGPSICAEAGFFRGAEKWVRFASLIWIETLVVLDPPMRIRKSDQRAWVPLPHEPRPGMWVGPPPIIRGSTAT